MSRETSKASSEPIENRFVDGYEQVDHNGRKEEHAPSRRSVLKGVGAGMVASTGSVLGFSTPTAANASNGNSDVATAVQEAVEGYRSRGAVRKTLSRRAGPLLNELRERGHLPVDSLEELATGQFELHTGPQVQDPADGVYVTAFQKDDTFTAHITVTKRTPSGQVSIVLQPQLDRSYAIIRSPTGDLETVLDPDLEDDVTINKDCATTGQSCPTGCCNSPICSHFVIYETVCCVYADGSTDCYEQATGSCCEPLG